MKTVNQRIKHLREQLGLSQQEFAVKTGTTQATIFRIESGKDGYTPHLSTIRTIAQVFGVAEEWLVENKGKLKINTPEGGDPAITQLKAHNAYLQDRIIHLEQLVIKLTNKIPDKRK